MMLPRVTASTMSGWLDAEAQGQPIVIGGQPVELRLAAISDNTIRFSVVPQNTDDAALNRDGALVDLSEQRRTIASGAPISIGQLSVSISPSPLVVRIADAADRPVQEISVDDSGAVHFLIGDRPLLGFGEGGAQFDRRGSVDAMRNGQGGYRLQTHGGRVPVQWLIGTGGWGLFIHQPLGTFDLSGPKGTLTPASPLPVDCFLVVSKDPLVIMDVKLIPKDPLGRAFTAGMFDGFVYLVDTLNGTSQAVFDCETIQPHVEVPIRGGMTQLMAMPHSGDRLIFGLFQAGQVGMLDVSDPEHPVQSGIVSLGANAGPHMIALTDDDKRLVVSDYFLNEDDFGKIHFEGDHHDSPARTSRHIMATS